MNYKDKIRLTLTMGENKKTKHGTDNEILGEDTGYCQAVSGLCDMTEEYDRMFTAESRYWLRFKESNPGLWKAQLNRLKSTRGTVFTTRLQRCMRWLNKK